MFLPLQFGKKFPLIVFQMVMLSIEVKLLSKNKANFEFNENHLGKTHSFFSELYGQWPFVNKK